MKIQIPEVVMEKVELTGQNLLTFNLVLVSLLIVYLVWRRPRRGMRLRLSDGNKGPHQKGQEVQRMDKDTKRPEVESPSAKDGEKPLNVIFNYNGHSWDAYEVLGLPAGASLSRVERAYEQALERVDADSRAFVEAAYRALKEHLD